MSLESGQRAPDSSEKGDVSGAAVQELRTKFQALVSQSRLSKEEKAACLGWLEQQESRDASQVKMRIEHLPKAEEASQKLVDAYGKKLDAAIQAGIFSKNAERKKVYVDWFANLSYMEKQKFLEKSDLDKPERKMCLESFKRLPAAVRTEMQKDFDDADLEGRQKMVKEATAKHEALKRTFLGLDKKVQEQYREQFKALGLSDREALLKTIAAVAGKTKPGEKNAAEGKEATKITETAETKQLIAAFDAKMEKLVTENLFSPRSRSAYQAWFSSLSLEQKRTALVRSDLDNPQRVSTRDAFYRLPEEKRKSLDLKFRNADLDGRRRILAALTKSEGASEGKTSYPETVIRSALLHSMQEEKFNHARLLYTMAKEAATLRRRAEIRFDAKKTETIAEKAAAREGVEVDEHRRIFLQDIEHHGDARSMLKKFLVAKKAKGQDAQANNLMLENANHEEIGAEQFNHLIVDHLHDEAVAGIVEGALGRLPGANPGQVQKIAQKMDITLDMRRVAA